MVLVDSNVLLRVLQRDHPMHKEAWEAVRTLHLKKELVLAPQNIVELWGSCNQAERDERRWVDAFPSSYVPVTSEAHIPMLLETPDIHQEWQRLVVEHQVSGKKAHDTRLVAAMRVHGVEGIVTFNGDDFRRYPGINVLHPRDLAQ